VKALGCRDGDAWPPCAGDREGSGLREDDLLLSFSASPLAEFEKDRRHRSDSLGTGADPETTAKGDCAKRRLEAVLLMIY